MSKGRAAVGATGTTEGGNGPQSWTAQAWNLLAQSGVQVQAGVAAEGGAGYGQPGNHGSVFRDLTARAVRRNDAIGPPWPSSTPPPAVLAIRDTLRSRAAAVSATFVDPIAEDWFVGRPDLIGPDGVHPTDAGHRFMAAKIAPLIYRQLTTQI